MTNHSAPATGHSAGMASVQSRVSVVWANDADPHRSARALLRDEVARWYAGPAEDVVLQRICRLCGSTDHGGLVVRAAGAPQVHVNLARSSGIAVVAVSDTGPVGLDVELPRTPRPR
jgi:4'-phosphopantetheinyl transferase